VPGTPPLQLVPGQSILAGNRRHRASWFIGLFVYFKLLHRGPAPAALNTGDPFHKGKFIYDIVVSIVLFPLLSLRNTDGAVIQGAYTIPDTQPLGKIIDRMAFVDDLTQDILYEHRCVIGSLHLHFSHSVFDY
jgi:hypothetical protein